MMMTPGSHARGENIGWNWNGWMLMDLSEGNGDSCCYPSND